MLTCQAWTAAHVDASARTSMLSAGSHSYDETEHDVPAPPPAETEHEHHSTIGRRSTHKPTTLSPTDAGRQTQLTLEQASPRDESAAVTAMTAPATAVSAAAAAAAAAAAMETVALPATKTASPERTDVDGSKIRSAFRDEAQDRMRAAFREEAKHSSVMAPHMVAQEYNPPALAAIREVVRTQPPPAILRDTHASVLRMHTCPASFCEASFRTEHAPGASSSSLSWDLC